MKTEELKNYTPKGDLEGFPKEIISRMLECQIEQGNPRDVNIFERDRNSTFNKGGFNWYSTKERYGFWSRVINTKNFNYFFERYPKKDNQGNQDNSQEFKVGDEVIDILTKQRGKILQIDYTCTFPVYLNNGESYTLDGRYNTIDIYPKLLHYRNDYDYDVIDFNNLPKRQECKRWRAEKGKEYHFIRFYLEGWFSISLTEENNRHCDNINYNSGNYFRTEVEAEIIAQKLNTYMKQLIQEEHE